jgi:hypothetical protein
VQADMLGVVHAGGLCLQVGDSGQCTPQTSIGLPLPLQHAQAGGTSV